MKIEKAKITGSGLGVLKLDLNDNGDHITLSASDPTLFDRFAEGMGKIYGLADEVPKRIEEIEKKYKAREEEAKGQEETPDGGFQTTISKTIEMSRENVRFSTEATAVVDGIFGEGTLKKYFRDVYEEIPDFLPDADCIIEFMENITPHIEKLFDKKLAARRERMDKYQPQDHKKPQRKATK